ncbi:DUF1190 domain-containing protein [Kordiimonas sp. SCSIO 12603]|uniref:DUF1190 domain-containing protein n=1 Tax=Kordiimonas sp. SCSIO 12603 TaxID=2829596 RepID=UPI0021079A80|nr:DUF1190 domain-containing protein [Kordiimonas sp. SCSIO 12603]UTW59635.1 DUF1190 domain-containing protein [Kordiimonas sp. SCSIO 12603]
MKRAKKLSLTLMAVGSATTLAACGDGDKREEVESYKDLESCLSAGVFSDQQCEDAYDKAKETHDSSAPRYDKVGLCEEQFGVGQCEQRTNHNGGSFWSPFFTGYIISSLLNQPSYGGGYYSTPYYQTRYGRRATWNGDYIKTYRDSNGRIQHRVNKESFQKPKPAKVLNRTAVISRGGFGTRPKARASKSRSRGGRSWGG